ncbi:MAG TPA: DmsE family decaheme c-type cytochrome [Vicinamibacterales bacterium]|nr:DmsE family decaheme c-type cytochrome [Vicinamibacterales bacterium]
MGRFRRSLSPKSAVAVALVMWAIVAVGVTATSSDDRQLPPGVIAAAAATPQSPPPAIAPSTAGLSALASGYVGDDSCLTCHEDKTKGYHGTPHARAQNVRTPGAGAGCESCHGPGEKHVDSGGEVAFIKNPPKLKPAEASELCTTCHNRSAHAEWDGSKHDARNLSCTSCHSVHDAKSEGAQLARATITETCVQCHQKEVSKVRKSSHMPVAEGKMECTTCHNPHGSQNVKMLREGTSINESCASCHAEKRGPFLWEHAVGRENCVTCHDPHGSNNDRMLVSKVPMLCQRCHSHSRHPSTVYDGTQLNNKSNRLVGRSCVNCHQMIHGSNHPTSGKMFMR